MKLVMLLLVVLLAVTNPSLEEFVDWAAREMTAEESAEWVKNTSVAVTRPIIKNITKRSNYGVLSIFTVKAVGEDKHYLGIGKQFMALNGMYFEFENNK